MRDGQLADRLVPTNRAFRPGGTVTDFTDDAKGRETERATSPVGYAGFATKPALANATRVVSTLWHATWNLPTIILQKTSGVETSARRWRTTPVGM